MEIFGICFHEWSAWSKVEVDKNGIPFQIKVCNVCGKAEIKRLY